ncbi:hypothetical protein PtB15_8B195 [Puccinia triticina]|nr:hypothetical protein PtB15_8B195 [Puccinia triticina]
MPGFNAPSSASASVAAGSCQLDQPTTSVDAMEEDPLDINQLDFQNHINCGRQSAKDIKVITLRTIATSTARDSN